MFKSQIKTSQNLSERWIATANVNAWKR